MNKKKKNHIKYFYQIISDIKNNIDTLIEELYENQNDLEGFSNSKPVIKKSKYPDLKKLGIIDKTNNNWIITEIGRELLDKYHNNDNEGVAELLASIIGTYNYDGFRPYAVLCKFLYEKYGVGNVIDIDDFKKFLSLPINEAIYYINSSSESRFKDIDQKETMVEAPRPSSYLLNYLENANLITKPNNKSFFLREEIVEFLEIFFADITDIPRYKKEKLKGYRIIGRGKDQVLFREDLLRAYKNKCAFTNSFLVYKNSNLLEAAHIIPVSQGGSYEITNGILMTPDLHKAFDSGAITLDDNYEIIVSDEVVQENYLPEDRRIVNLPDNENEYPSLISVSYHRDRIYCNGVMNR